jgi:hypothetical protein
MMSSLPQGMDFWGLCRLIGDAVAVYALFVLMLAAIRAGWALLKRLTYLSVRAACIATGPGGHGHFRPAARKTGRQLSSLERASRRRAAWSLPGYRVF